MNTVKITLLFAICTLLVGAHPAISIDLTDYTFPVSTSQQAFLNGAFNLNGSSADSTQTAYNLGGSGTYDLFYRSLPLEYQLSALGNFSFLRGELEGADDQNGYNTGISTRLNKYFKDDSKVFGFGEANVEYRKLNAQDEADDPYADVTIGFGYGRSIDATVLKQAVRLSEDFQKYNVTNSPIPDKGLLELAQIIDKKSEFRSTYGVVEYRKYWYEAMENVLMDYDVLTGDGLGAMGAIRIEEVLAEPTGFRFHGWQARAGFGIVVSDFDGEAGDPLFSLGFDWARPLGMQLQLNNNAYLSTVLVSDPAYNLGDEFQIYYEISNRIDWDNRFKINYTINSAEGLENVLNLTFTSTYILYIENQLTFNPSFVLSYVDDGINDALTDWAILGSISYRLK
ncbi:hypothetical protein KJ564_07700 [bacterium]|nr:hypothetical protein [bacterium]